MVTARPDGHASAPSPVPPPDRQPVIEIRGVRHVFQDARTGKPVRAVERVDLSIAEGEFVSIVGPSGCGKTTLLNIVSGLIRPSYGQALVDGREVKGLQPRLIGYMFARDSLLPWRSVIKNVELGLELAGSAERHQRAQELVSLVGLDGFEDKYPDQLSQGMRQRVALARTLATDPRILLMDEPFGALDAQTKLLMEDEFLRIWEANQKTVLFITHDLVEALTMSDRVIVFAARPGYIKASYQIAFPRPRSAADLPTDPEFQRLHRQIWNELKVENVRRTA